MKLIKLARKTVLLAGALTFAGCEGENLFDIDQNPFIVPRVTVSAPDFAFAGDSLGVIISGEAGRGVRFVEVSFSGAVNRDTVITILGGGVTSSSTVFLALPNAITDSLVFATAQVVDATGRRSVARTDTIRVFGPTAPAGAPVVVSLTGLDTSRVGRIYDVRARAQGTLPIKEFIFRFRGAANQTVTVPVAPSTIAVADAEVTLSLAETFLQIDVVAVDVNGGISALGGAASKNVQVFPRLAP